MCNLQVPVHCTFSELGVGLTIRLEARAWSEVPDDEQTRGTARAVPDLSSSCCCLPMPSKPTRPDTDTCRSGERTRSGA
jgi:hypothetical protein